MKLQGTFTALVTPMREGTVDMKTFEALLERQIAAGIQGLVVCGTTGEAATLTQDEYESLVRATVKAAAGRLPVIAGTGSNDTRSTILRTKQVRDWGVDAALVVTPYYNKPTQEGLYHHYERLASEAGLPMVLYNVPGRTGANLAPGTTARLADIDEIVALKEASSDWSQLYDDIRLCAHRIDILSGNDDLAFPAICAGAAGVISVASNVIPEAMNAMVQAALQGNLAEARKLHYHHLDLMRALFFETNPAPAKQAMAFMGLMSPEVRLPLWEMRPENAQRLQAVLQDLNLIPPGA